jgi:hypothetical protein
MNWSSLSWGAMAEVAIGLAMLAGALWLYRRPAPATEETGERAYGSQGAVLMIIVAAILLIHGLGGLDYRPSQAEIDAMTGQG